MSYDSWKSTDADDALPCDHDWQQQRPCPDACHCHYFDGPCCYGCNPLTCRNCGMEYEAWMNQREPRANCGAT